VSAIEQATMNFYGWWQAITCLFAFLALMSIWWHLGRRKNDYSQIWLALSVLCWSLTGFADVLFSGLWISEVDRSSGVTSILSLANSFFILLSLPWFKYLPKSVRTIVKSKYWIYIIGLPFIFSLLPTLNKVFFAQSNSLVSELDVYYSILTLGFLGLVLWESFDKRRLKLLAWLSLSCILITFIAQIYKLTGNEVNMRLLSSIFKSSLIMIFFALALSWVKDLSESIIPKASKFRLKLENYLVILEGIPGRSQVKLELSTAPLRLLNLFLDAKTNNDQWLEIKPKNESRTQKDYAIKDHNEIKRLTHALLDGIYGKNNWTKEQHELAFKEEFYETSPTASRKIRLQLPKENILPST
jgi:hypothetical protein